MTGLESQRWTTSIDIIVKLLVEGFRGSPQQYASVDSCLEVPGVTSYVVAVTPPAIKHSTAPLLQRPTRERDYDVGPDGLPVQWKIFENFHR